MSYILDALKKSEQERGHGNIPGVQTMHSSSLNYTNRKTYWPYILIVAVTLNLAAILYFIFYQDKAEESPATTAIKKPVNNTMPVLHTVQTSPVSAGIQEKKDPDNTVAGTQPPAAHRVASPHETDDKTSNITSTSSARESENIAEDTSMIVEFDELPQSIKQQLPAIIITAHVYSTNPQQRSVVINNNFMEEGEYFLDDLILHEITTDGAIFYYKDIKFHLGVVSGWQ